MFYNVRALVYLFHQHIFSVCYRMQRVQLSLYYTCRGGGDRNEYSSCVQFSITILSGIARNR